METTSPWLSEIVGFGVNVMLAMGPMLFECPPPQLAKKTTRIRTRELTTADRQYCIDPPHPCGVVIKSCA
jgi:hypothetical protein